MPSWATLTRLTRVNWYLRSWVINEHQHCFSGFQLLRDHASRITQSRMRDYRKSQFKMICDILNYITHNFKYINIFNLSFCFASTFNNITLLNISSSVIFNKKKNGVYEKQRPFFNSVWKRYCCNCNSKLTIIVYSGFSITLLLWYLNR